MKELRIPAPESPYPRSDTRIRIFEENGSAPFEFGKLKKDEFTYLGDWLQIMNPDGYGILYRLGVKNEVIDDEGDSTTILFHFYIPIAISGYKLADKDYVNIQDFLRTFVMKSTLKLQQKEQDNITGIALNPPEWMIEELNQNPPHGLRIQFH